MEGTFDGTAEQVRTSGRRMKEDLTASVSDISHQLGFAEPAHFTRFFRNHAGVSPSEFRSVSRFAN